MNGNLSEIEIDKLVVSQLDDDLAWEKPIRVNRQRSFSVILPKLTEISSEKEVLDGEPVFRGTTVPISALLENLENGASLDEFLEKFPSVSREQAVKVLELFRNSLARLRVA